MVFAPSTHFYLNHSSFLLKNSGRNGYFTAVLYVGHFQRLFILTESLSLRIQKLE